MFDRTLFVGKINKYLDHLQLSTSDLYEATGISLTRINELIDEKDDPSGDEVLILADFFKCDYNFFISNDNKASFEKIDQLFRQSGDVLSKLDKRNIIDFIYLCECEDYLINSQGEANSFINVNIENNNNSFINQGKEAAIYLRKVLGYKPYQVPGDIFQDFRRIGIHIFRRQLEQSSISGVYIKHPEIGKCILVNYDEDFYRQRFTVSHEIGHAIFNDSIESCIFNYNYNYSYNDLLEIRANRFASNYLIPIDYIKSIPQYNIWDENKFLRYAKELQVNTITFAIALKTIGLINNNNQFEVFKNLRIHKSNKCDPELSSNLDKNSREKKQEFLKRGLSDYYVALCFKAYKSHNISFGRLKEMLMSTENDVLEMQQLLNIK